MNASSVATTPSARARRDASVTSEPLTQALSMGAPAWDDVVRRAGCGSPFMSWAWHRAWADSADPAAVRASEVLRLHGADGSLHAVLPIRVERARFRRLTVPTLTWAIGDAGCPDELDVGALQEADMSTLAAALDAMPWQLLILGNLAEPAPRAQELRDALVALGHTARERRLWRCPQFTLPQSWDAYLAGLSSNRRQVLRRKERNLRRDHTVTLTDYDGDQIDAGWRHLMELHEQRWEGAGGGAFTDPRIARQLRLFAGEMAQQKRLWLTTLDLGGQPAAAWYGFTSDTTVYFYQGGRDPRFEHESVGLVLMGVMIRRAIERGYRSFNFLRGDDAYKKLWTGSYRTTHETLLFRSGWAGQSLRVLDAIAALRGRDGDA